MTGKMFAHAIAILLLANVVNACSQDKPATQYVLMVNGQAISGTIESSDNQTTVVKPSGSILLLDNHKIRTIVNSLSEVYWFKCANLSATDSQGHSALYYWCVEKKLFTEAQNQIDLMQSMRISPSRMLGMHENLQAKIKAERERVEREQFAMQSLPAQPVETENVIRQASFEEVVDASEAVVVSKKLLTANNKQTDFFAADLSVGFNEKIKSATEPAKAAGFANAAKLPKPVEKVVAGKNESREITQVDPFDPEIFNRRYLAPGSPPM